MESYKGIICSRNSVLLLFHQECNTYKSVSLYLAFLTSKSNQYVFVDHKMSFQSCAQYSEGHQ